MYMEIAGIIAKQSYAKRLQVGAIVVKEDRIISIGYNGMPAGWDNDCEKRVYSQIPQNLMSREQYHDENVGTYYLVTKPEVIHAEANAIAKLAKSSESGDGSTMFLTHAPCLDCAKQMYTAGINKIYFQNHYKNNDGIDFLEKCGIKVEQCSIGENT